MASLSAVECRFNNIKSVGKNVPYRVILDIPDNELVAILQSGVHNP
jgi:hypothetical protein